MVDKSSLNSIFNRLVLCIAAVYFVLDIYEDLSQGEPLSHVMVECTVFVLILVCFALEIMARATTRSKLDTAEKKITDITSGLAERVGVQFDQWRLSESEKDVAWLIIKGFSFAEIAALRSVKEKTVRQQATSIYAKSSVKNRSEFTASFLEDLLGAS